MSQFHLAIALLLAALSHTLAQPAAPAPASLPTPPNQPPQLQGRENAALLYYRAWDLLSREDSQTVGNSFSNAADYKQTPEEIKALEDNQKYVDLVLRAANTPACDWGIQYDQGWDALLPHLSKMRQSCRFLGADARRCFDAGKPTEGAERLAAIARMAEQTRSDGILISALVGAAIASYACAGTEVAFELHALTPSSARTILNALREINQEDAFGSFSAIRFEEWAIIDWPRIKFTGPKAGHELRLLVASEASDPREEADSPLERMNAEQLAFELEKTRPYFEQVRKAWSEPDAAARLNDLSDRASKGEFGETAKVLVPAFGKARAGIDKCLVSVNATIKNLETFINTGQTPADLAAQAQETSPQPAR